MRPGLLSRVIARPRSDDLRRGGLILTLIVKHLAPIQVGAHRENGARLECNHKSAH